jgi:tetratricopeptide (TPR) repeat protein
MTDSGTRWRKWLLAALLAGAVLAVYAPALDCGFVNFDDPDYVTQNWHVQHGLNWQSVRWAFTAVASANWHPLTWLSHILDCQFYGPRPWGHHLTSLLFHLANTVLLFLLLNRMTGALWRSALVAALFALHPLRVESVVWVAERKDVLSTFFWMLTVGAWLRYAENLKSQMLVAPERSGGGSNFKFFYALALLFYALGLMAKPMLVTLPFVLLLLDYWPLGRLEFGPRFSRRLVIEKIPFFILAACQSTVTYLVQNHFGVVATLARYPAGARLENIPVAYTRYLTRNFWPSDLAAFYPSVAWRPGEIIGAILALGLITLLVLWRRRPQPYLAVGWFWFLGMLAPTIGLVQVGAQSLADRYTYLPCVGLWIMAVWGLHNLAAKSPIFRAGVAAAGCLALTLYAALAWHQTSVYKDSQSLWEATLRNYPNCLPAHNNLAKWFFDTGRLDQAIAQCRQTLAILPTDPTAPNLLALICLRQGKVDEAIAESLKSIRLQPRSDGNRQTLGRAYLQKGRFALAAASFKEALALNPSAAEAWCNLGYALLQLGQLPEAAAAYAKALDSAPDYALAHNDLGNILLRQGREQEAMEHFQRAVQLAPDFAEAHFNLAGILARRGRLDEAIAHCQRALELQPALEAARQRLAALTAAREGNHGR